MTSPTVTALCGIVIVVLHGCFAVEPVTTGGQLWLSGSGVNGKDLKAAMARTFHNVPRLSRCAFHCRQLGEACASFFYNELASTCTLCKADRCDKLDLVEGAQNPNIIFFSRMTCKDITKAIYNRLWLGGHRSATTGKWVWGDGSSAEAFLGGKWSSGQPTAKDYLAISTFDGFSMLALDYNTKYHYICEIDVVQ